MTKQEKEIILNLAMKYDFAAGLTEDSEMYEYYYRTIGHFAAMFSLMDKLNLLEEYEAYVENNKEKLERWRKGKFYL